jgi:hypothetical protein
MSDGPGSRTSLTAVALAAVAVACCLVPPLLAGVLGSVAIGSLLGALTGALCLLALCAFLFRRLRGRGSC